MQDNRNKKYIILFFEGGENMENQKKGIAIAMPSYPMIATIVFSIVTYALEYNEPGVYVSILFIVYSMYLIPQPFTAKERKEILDAYVNEAKESFLHE